MDRKTGRRIIHVPRASVCIAGGVQPKALAAALIGRYQPQDGASEGMSKPDKEHFDNGLAARLLFAMPPRRPKRWTEDELPAGTEAALEALVGRLLALGMVEDEKGQPQPVDISLSPLGKQAWIAFYNAHAVEQAEMTGELAAAWSKLEGYSARFALLVHLIRAESSDTTLADVGAVDEQSIAAGVALSRWFGDEAARVYGIIGGGPRTQRSGNSVSCCGLYPGIRRSNHRAATYAKMSAVSWKSRGCRSGAGPAGCSRQIGTLD